tara:strand:- start:1986 stop:4220 length:2235 start_codon:yes stop_codon:yes gene_type:complete
MRLSIGLVKRPTAMAAALAVGILGVFATLSSTSVQAQENNLDPSDIWYRGFLLVQAAGDLEERGKYLESLNKLTEAKPLFDHLAQVFPDYQPDIIRDRRHLIADKRDELKQRLRAPAVAQAPPAVSTGRSPSQSGNPSIQIGPPPIPSNSGARSRNFEVESNDGEFALPSWGGGNNQQLPNVGSPDGMPRVETRSGVPSVGSIANSLHDDLAKKDSLIDWLNDENLKLRTQLREREGLLKDVNAELSQANSSRNELMRQIQQMEQGPGGVDAQQKIGQLKGLLRDATDQLKEATDRNEQLVAELGHSQKEIQKLKGRMTELEKERDNLAEVVRGQGNTGTALKELMERNRKLTEQLDRAEQLASSLSELNKAKDNDIAMLKSEVSKIKFERDRLMSENQRHQQSIDDLQRKLEMLSDGLTADEQNAMANASPVEQQENELLRSIVLKQLRRQAQMKQAKNLLIRQLDKVGARSDLLLGLIDDMARGSQLSDEEKELFKAPQFQEIVDAAAETVDEDGSAHGTKTVSTSATFIAPGGSGNMDVVKNQKITIELSQIEKSARLDFGEGRLSEAESGFLEYLRYRPKSVPCLCNLGVLKISMKNYSEAENYLERALAIDDKSGLAHYLLGRAYYLQNKLDDAMASLEQGLTHDPQNAKAHNCVGVISTQKGWVSRAERAFTNAVSIDPDYGDAHFNLAVLYATKEQPDPSAAEKHYFKALHLGVPRDSAIEGYLEEFEAAGQALGMR